MEKAGGRDEGSPEGERSQGQPGGINIQGNDYRLIAVVQYDHDVLMIRFLGSHGDYDKVDAESACDPADQARMVAQACLAEAYERSRWPRRMPSLPDLLTYLMDQHGLTRADLIPLLGTASRVSEVLAGKRELSMTMVRKLRQRFHIPADLLIPPLRSSEIAA